MDSMSPDAALMAGGASFRVVRPVNGAAMEKGGTQSLPSGSKPKRAPQVLDLLHPETWTKPALPRQWNVQDWIPRRRVTLFQANGGDGKTLLAQQLLTCTATSLPWLGLETTPGRALGVLCEDEPEELQRRQESINAALGVEPHQLKDLRLLSRLGEDSTLIDFAKSDIGDLTGFFEDLDATLAGFKPVILVLDTAADMFGGNENIRPQVRRFVGTCLGRLALDHDCGILLLAHPSQAGLRDGSGNSGSTAWSNTVRSRIYMTRPGDEEGSAPSDRRVLTRMKSNYAPRDARVDIVWSAGAFIVTEAGDAFDTATWPIIDKMFDEIARAWDEGTPWSPIVQTRESGRYFPAWAKAQHGIPEKRSKALLGEWMMNGCLVNEAFDSRAKTKGLRVIRRPSQ